MIAKRLATGLIGSALLASVAFAAEAPSTNNAATNTSNPSVRAVGDTTAASHQGEWRTSKIVGLNVYNANNEKVGDINDVLIDKSGAIKAVVIGVGGFLGMGEHLVAVPFDKIKFVEQPVSSASNTTTPSTNRPASTTTTTGAAGTATTTSSASTTSSSANRWYPDHAMFNATKDELKAMPEFKWNS